MVDKAGKHIECHTKRLGLCNQTWQRMQRGTRNGESETKCKRKGFMVGGRNTTGVTETHNQRHSKKVKERDRERQNVSVSVCVCEYESGMKMDTQTHADLRIRTKMH